MKPFRQFFCVRVASVFTLVLLLFASMPQALSQDNTYTWHWAHDGPALGAGAALMGTSWLLRYNASPVTEQEVLALDKATLWSLDRTATTNFSASAKRTSDFFLFGSAALPASLIFSAKARSETAVIAGMFAETMLYTDGIINTLKATTNRLRPFTYNPDVPLEEKLNRDARFSFASGHVSGTAAVSWFTAKVINDLYPNSKWRPAVWAGAVAIPATVAWLRYRAGRHFPTDVVAGYAVGASMGWLVPALHKISNDKLSLRVIPVPRGVGMGMQLRIG